MQKININQPAQPLAMNTTMKKLLLRASIIWSLLMLNTFAKKKRLKTGEKDCYSKYYMNCRKTQEYLTSDLSDHCKPPENSF